MVVKAGLKKEEAEELKKKLEAGMRDNSNHFCVFCVFSVTERAICLTHLANH